MLKWMASKYYPMTSGEIWLRWVLVPQLIVSDVNHMVVMELLELNLLNLVDMVHLLDLEAVAHQDLEVQVALDNLTFLVLDNTPTSLEMEAHPEIMVHQITNNADVKLNLLAHLALMDQLVKQDLMA